METKKSFYLGNQNIKKSGVIHSFSQEEVNEYLKCMHDPIYFINSYIKMNTLDSGVRNITLYSYQEALIKMYMNERFSLVLAPRQSSKCCIKTTQIKIRNKKTHEILITTLGELFQFIKEKTQTC